MIKNLISRDKKHEFYDYDFEEMENYLNELFPNSIIEIIDIIEDYEIIFKLDDRKMKLSIDGEIIKID